ncbi:MAG: hypothetical protein QM736_02960 [Vicinamibacterales bacterium]
MFAPGSVPFGRVIVAVTVPNAGIASVAVACVVASVSCVDTCSTDELPGCDAVIREQLSERQARERTGHAVRVRRQRLRVDARRSSPTRSCQAGPRRSSASP